VDSERNAAEPDGGSPVWEQLAPGVARRRLPFLDVTIGLVVGGDGVLLVDTGSSLREGAELRGQVEALTGRGVTHVVLTHGHFDHVLGTAEFPGAEVYGERSLGPYLRREQLRMPVVAAEYGADPLETAEAVRSLVHPDRQVRGELALDLGERPVHLVHVGPGHTGHDLVVHVPGATASDPAVVFCGDLVEESGEPQAGPDADPASWPAALDRLLSLGGEDALYVPGHGAVVDAAFVRAQRDVLARRLA
jgi:glyoxylase-like metal-dependent hydrolase (beta-lactamase superfamily II)